MKIIALTNKKLVNKAFRELRKLGYVAYQNFWCCSNCAWSALNDEEAKKAVFYHSQDNDTMLKMGKLWLSWSGDGEEICKVLRDCGLKSVEWDGSENKRILIDLNVI